MAEKKASTKTPAKVKSASASPSQSSTAASADSEASPASDEGGAASARGTCTVENCGQPLRAKGYCRKHFMAWRREKLGAHHHYKICGKEACRKRRAFGGFCAEHSGKAEGAPAAGGTAAT